MFDETSTRYRDNKETKDSKKSKSPFLGVGFGVLIFVALIFLFGATYVTKENEYTVIKQFGEIKSVDETAGLGFKTPFIQSISRISKAKQLYDVNPSEVITSDKKTMIIDAYVIWEVVDAKKFTSTLSASATTAQGRIDVIVYNALKNTISSMTQDELIASRDVDIEIETSDTVLDDVEINDIKTDENGNVIEDTNKEEEKEIVVISDILLSCVGDQDDQYGIKITDIKIKVLDLPEDNTQAVYNRMITERNNIAAAYKAQGESEAQIIRNTTDAEISIVLSEANAKAEATIAEGEAEYMRILSEAYNDPDKADFYTFSLQLDAIKDAVNNGNTTLILDSDSPIAKIFDGIQ